MTDEVHKIRDKRRKGWYDIDNEVYDYPMSCEALAMYNSIARYANEHTQKAYFSARKFMSHHKIGKAKYAAAKAELIKLGLISETGEKTLAGAIYYELCDVKANPVLTRDRSSADAAALPIPTRPTNKTNTKTNKQNVAKATVSTADLDEDLEKAIVYIQSKTGCVLKSDKWLKIWWYQAVRIDGIDNLKRAIKGFAENKPNIELGKWDWVSFFKFQAKRATFIKVATSAPNGDFIASEGLQMPFKSTLPDFSHIKYDDAPIDEEAWQTLTGSKN